MRGAPMSSTKKKRSSPGEGDYEVGYGKPPEHSRFQPGKSGNSKGRPRGSRNFKSDVKMMLTTLVRVTRDGKPRKISTQEAMLLRLCEKALSGDIRAITQYMMLAQSYNNEEMSGSTNLNADDSELLQIFAARLSSGAAEIPNAPNTEDESPEASSATPPTVSAETPQAGKIKRARSARRVPSDEDTN
jgi:uncharacterized protein DUF5681